MHTQVFIQRMVSKPEKRFQTMLSTKANRKEQKFIDLNEMTKMTDCIYPKLSIDSHWLPTPVSTVS